MKTLIIHHLEPCWESGYKKAGTSFEELILKFRNHLKRRKYQQVILTRFDGWELEDDHNPIRPWITRVEQYGYGWCEEDKENNPNTLWCEGGTHSEVVAIDEWMIDLPKSNVYLSGAFDGECIEDMEIALSHLSVKFTRLNDLIV